MTQGLWRNLPLPLSFSWFSLWCRIHEPTNTRHPVSLVGKDICVGNLEALGPVFVLQLLLAC